MRRISFPGDSGVQPDEEFATDREVCWQGDRDSIHAGTEAVGFFGNSDLCGTRALVDGIGPASEVAAVLDGDGGVGVVFRGGRAAETEA